MTGLPWPTILRDFAVHLHWTAEDVLDRMSWAEFYTVWLDGGSARRPHNPTAIFDKIDRLRAAKGLPPMDRTKR